MYKRYERYKDSGVEWIGEIPEHWSISKIKYQAKINNKVLNEKTPEDYEIKYLDIGNVDSDGKVIKIEPTIFKDAPSRARRIISDGDTLVSTVRTYLKAITWFNKAEKNLICSTGFAVLSPKNSINPKYLSYLMRSPLYIEEIVSRSVGVSYPSITSKEIGDLECIMPRKNTKDIKEQEAIANYLDQKTSKIDSLIADKEELIKKLEEYKQSIITEAVTKGLNPDVKMKASGIEWIGEIPEHWEIKKVKYLYRIRNDRNQKAKNEVQLLTLYSAFGVRREEEFTDKTGNIVRTVKDYKIVYPDDIVVNIILAWMGSIGMSKYHGVISPAYDIYKPLDGTFSQFYNYYFRTYGFSGDCFKNGRGIMLMRWRTYSDEFRSIYVCVPPYNEQYMIAEYLDKKMAEIDNLIDDSKSHINKLKSYRQSLIYEAVTGKIDVRNYQPERSEQLA